jgi:hypothetical protein
VAERALGTTLSQRRVILSGATPYFSSRSSADPVELAEQHGGENMPIELNKEQQEQLDRDARRPPIVHDPRSATRYVLIAADQYEQMLEVVEDGC